MQRLRVRRTEILATGHGRDCFEALLVKFHRDLAVDRAPERINERKRSIAATARADSIDFDPEGLGRFGRGQGRDPAHVVVAIGQEHDDFRFGLFVFEAVGGRGEGRPDGRAVFDQADPDALEVGDQPVVVEGERTDQIRAPGKGDNPDAVVRTAFDEFFGHLFDRLETVGPLCADGEILGQHGTRDIDDQHDIDAAGLGAGDRLAQLRPGQRENEEDEREIEQAGEKIPRARTAATADLGQGLRGGKHHTRGAPEFALQPREHGDKQKQPEELRINEAEGGEIRQPRHGAPPL